MTSMSNIAAILFALFALWLAARRRITDFESTGSIVHAYQEFPLPVLGVVVISDAASGVAREAALMLADHGLHVLAGVRSKQVTVTVQQYSVQPTSRPGRSVGRLARSLGT